MADKRQSVGGKAATPKSATQSQDGNGQTAALSKVIGARVKITTSLPSLTLEGTLYTADPITNVIALNTAPPPPNPSSNAANQPGDYHIIPIAHIAHYQIISLPTDADRIEGSGPGFNGALPSISKIDLDALKAREEAAVKKLKEREATRNKAASKEGQEIFDHMSRTLPTRWHENSIVVNDLVIIKPPYSTNDIQASKDGQNSIQQIMKILEAYYSKNKTTQNSTSRPGSTTSVPPRKGG